jgi:hypothetical protein
MVLEAYKISAKYKMHAVTREIKLLTKVMATQLESESFPGSTLTEKNNSITVMAIKTADSTKKAVAILMILLRRSSATNSW